MTSERLEGPTPNGGAYGMIYYFDDNNNAVTKENATKAMGCEYDKDDNMINETWLVIQKDTESVENENKTA